MRHAIITVLYFQADGVQVKCGTLRIRNNFEETCPVVHMCRRNDMVRNKQAAAAGDEWARINALKAAHAEQQGECCCANLPSWCGGMQSQAQRSSLWGPAWSN